MHATRWIPVVSVLCAVSLLSSCSGDDDNGDADPSSTPRASSSASGDAEAKSRTCKVEVAVTGAVEAAWTGKGTSQTGGSGPKAIYLAEHDGAQLIAYAAGGDIPTSANVTSEGQTFTSTGEGLTLKATGKGAEIDADATGVDPDSRVHVTASFDC